MILAAGAGGRNARVRASGRKAPREEGGGRTRKGGRNGDAWGKLCGKAGTGWRTTVRGVTAEDNRERWGHKYQVSSNRDRGERLGDVQGDSDAESEGWSARREGGSAE